MLIAFSALFALSTISPAHGATTRNTCDTVTSRVGLVAMAGMPIRSVDVRTLPPNLAWPHVAEPLTRVHMATLPSTVRRELLFAPGEAVDSVRVAESLRRLRALGYLEDVQLEARTCVDSVGVAVTVVTRDAWSTQPILQLRSRSLALGVAETNAFGTGRLVRLTVQSDVLGFGVGASIRDPAIWNGRLDGQVGMAAYGSGSRWTFAFRPRKRTLADPWTGEFRGIGTHREVEGGSGSAFDETRFALLGGPRITSRSSAASVYVLGGAVTDRADLRWSPLDPLIGPRTVRREFVGGALGIVRRATRYDTLGWVLRHDGIVDIPTVTEGELVTAYGRDHADGRAKANVDGWTARTWTSANRALITAGLWTSGYIAERSIEAGTVRSALVAVSPTANGTWQLRMAAEHLYDPDPTVRALKSVDPIGAMLPRAARFARSAATVTAERAFRLGDLTRSSELDVALFGALARRWDTAGALGTDVGASLVGVGLRLAPSRTPGATFRLDFGYPVGFRAGVPARPVFAISIVPWLTGGHQRDAVSASAW